MTELARYEFKGNIKNYYNLKMAVFIIIFTLFWSFVTYIAFHYGNPLKFEEKILFALVWIFILCYVYYIFTSKMVIVIEGDILIIKPFLLKEKRIPMQDITYTEDIRSEGGLRFSCLMIFCKGKLRPIRIPKHAFKGDYNTIKNLLISKSYLMDKHFEG